jgi:pyrroline-5-carboxylate reductase
MGSAILKQWYAKSLFTEVTVIDPFFSAQEQNIKTYHNIQELNNDYQPDIILIAIKPQEAQKALLEYQKFDNEKTIIISIMAGKEVAFLRSVFQNSQIARVMPNMAAMIGQSTSLVSYSPNCNQESIQIIQKCVASFGKYMEVDEEDFTKITLITGCAPAYFYQMCEEMKKVLINFGINEKNAQETIINLLHSSSEMIKDNVKENVFNTMITNIASKGGVTEAMLDKLSPHIESGFKEGVENGLNRSIFLSK